VSERGKAVWTRRRVEGVDGAPDFRDLWGAVFEGLRENFTGLGPRFGLPGMPGIIG
jgi:hypothetical protein